VPRDARDGTRIAYEAEGGATPREARRWRPRHRGWIGMTSLAAPLASGHAAVASDRRGRGDSGNTPPYGVERDTDDVAALIDEVGSPVHMFGLRSGALLALRTAAGHGDRSHRASRDG
jgi:pimeloyl-ACP methyl ester carboxylesterase